MKLSELTIERDQISSHPRIKTLQSVITKRFPNIKCLDLSDQMWLDLNNYLAKNSPSATRLSSLTILTGLSEILTIPYDDVVSALAVKKQHERTARKRPATDENSSHSFSKHHKRRNNKSANDNPLILDSTNTPFFSPLKEQKIRYCALSPHKPIRGYSEVFHTPEGKTLVRPLIKNNAGSFFKPVTPVGDKASRGMADIHGARKSLLFGNTVPKLRYERPGPARFRATLAKLKDRAGQTRRCSQKQLTGASCRDVFQAHGHDVIIKNRGSDYHWSHLIAHFLGGNHNKENLIPGTAASNYNTLELVEQFIAQKLSSDDHAVPYIDITVNPRYGDDEALIPDELIFNLDWQETRPDKTTEARQETIYINPRSYQRVSPAMLDSIRVLRTMKPKTVPKEQEPVHHGLRS
ncbi:DNA/RNA non-specific endonuclease [Legionella spiritensis]|uniref:DNA/RNA non-specific endonuclease n=1 Tax=Legionella spiritensis TaxID=452 RepID=UPI000F6E264F|nr:DNA/RNA non-specific endonuclease [Legionella spiritensis]VEG91961.1 Uncharacterised protein [Legionella spiritensis]